MISVVTGKVGGGKSLLVLAKILDHIAKGGLVITNIKLLEPGLIAEMKRRKKVYHSSQFRWIDLNKSVDFCSRLSCGTDELSVMVVIDEAHLFYNSKNYRKLDSEIELLTSFFTQSRKFNIDIWLITQHPGTLYGQFKQQAADLYYCVDMRRVVFPIFGRMSMMGLQWIRRDFESNTKQEQGKTPLISTIFDCYDTKQTFDAFATDLKATLPVFHPINSNKKCSDSLSSSSLSSRLLEVVGFYSFKKSLRSQRLAVSQKKRRGLVLSRLLRIRKLTKNNNWPRLKN